MASLEWDQRAQLGTLRAHLATSLRFIRAPRGSFALEAAEGRVSEALLFAGWSYAYVILPSMIVLYFVTMSPTFGSLRMSELYPRLTPQLIALAATAAYGVSGFALLMLQLVACSLVEWGSLKLLRVPQATFANALRAHAFSEAPLMLGLLPVLGASVATVWALAIRVFAIRRFQEVSTGQAVFAALSPLLLLCGVTAALVAALLA